MREAGALAIALGVFGLCGLPIFATFAAGYLIGWAVISRTSLIGWTGGKVFLLCCAAIGLLRAYALKDQLLEAEQLAGLPSVLADRFSAPNEIAPRLVHGDRRQRFFALEDPGFGRAERWGHGLWAIDFDPSKDQAPPQAIVPRPTPRATCSDPSRGVAAIVSEETDSAYLVDRTGKLDMVEAGDQPLACAFFEGAPVFALRSRQETAIAADAKQIAVGIETNVRRGIALFERPGGPEVRFIDLQEGPDHLEILEGRIYAALRRARTIVAIGDEHRTRFLGRPAVSLTKTYDGRGLVVPLTDDLRSEEDAGANHTIRDQLLVLSVPLLQVRAQHPAPGSPIEVIATSETTYLSTRAGSGQIAGPVFQNPLPGAYGLAELGEGIYVATSPATHTILVFDFTGRELAKHVLAELDDRDRGELAFLESTRSGVSCQSCHLHADSDLSPHDIGHGRPSPTLSLRNLAGTSPYLRGASYPTLASLEDFANTLLGGYERELPRRAELLEKYLTTLPPLHVPVRPQDPRASIEAFVKAGCEECHAFPAFTNLAQVPASFLFPELGDAARLLDTPTLIGVSRTAPYLDDGRAQTLEEIFEKYDPSARHGDFGALSEAEKKALLDLLEHL